MNSDKRITNDFLQAAGLLEADLIWSDDLESIRLDLATYLRARASLGSANHAALVGLVQHLLADENDLSV
jgi:hypothetical protein